MDLPNYALVLGIDETSERRAFKICRSAVGLMDGIKVEIDDSYIPRIKKETGLPIIADGKLAHNAVQSDKGYVGTTGKRVGKLAEKGADYVIIQLFTGPLPIEEAVDAGRKHGVKILGLPKMTHKTSGLMFDHHLSRRHVEYELKGLGYDGLIESSKSCKTFTDFFIEEIDYFNLDGFMYPAFETDSLIQLRKRFPDKLIGTMGLGVKQWPNKNETLKEQMKKVFPYTWRNSATVLASHIYEDKDYTAKMIEAKSWRDEIVSELNQMHNITFGQKRI